MSSWRRVERVVLLADGMVRVLDLGMYLFEIGVGERRHRCSPPNENAPEAVVPGALQNSMASRSAGSRPESLLLPNQASTGDVCRH